jgi:Cytidylyltransferase-like
MLQTCVDAIIKGALAQVAESPAAAPIGIAPGYVEKALTTLLQRIGSSFAPNQAQPIDLRLRRAGSAENQASTVFYRNNPPRVGVFPLVANPPHWGHIIASLAAVDALGLDVMVFLPADDVDDQSTSDHQLVDEQDRYAMVARTIELFAPIFQYTDVACGTKVSGECAVHYLRELNRDQQIDFDLVCYVNSEMQVRRIMSLMLSCTQDKALLARASRHHLDLSFIDGVGKRTVEFDPERLWRYRREIGLQLRCQLVHIDMPELTPFRSRNYRASGEAALVPRAVHQYAIERNLYR